MQSLVQFFEELGYMAHGLCLMWQPWLIALFAGSDFLIFAAYSVIPLALHRVIRARRDIENRWIAYLFAAFILLCGLSHLMAIFTLWIPIYEIQGAFKLATALVSVATAVFLFPLVPKISELPSHDALRVANARLTDEIVAHEATLNQLRNARDRLEDKVSERTKALERTNEELNIVLRQAGDRAGNLERLIEALARQTRAQADGESDFLEKFQLRISEMVAASDALIRDDGAMPKSIQELVLNQLSAYMATFPNRFILTGEDYPLMPTAARQIAMALNELATNAIKHGALLHEGGKIELAWSCYQRWPDGKMRFQLNWMESLPESTSSDRGALETIGPSPMGYGTRVLNITVPKRLNGRAEVDYSDGGLSYSLDLPTEDIIRPQAAESKEARIVDQVSTDELWSKHGPNWPSVEREWGSA